MAVSDDIVATYRGPARVMRRLLSGDRHEARALAYLIAALALAFVAQWPALARAAHLQPEVVLTQRMVAALLAALAAVPACYAIAAAGHLLARALGGRGDFFGARMALFWAMLAVAPVVLLHGLVRAFIGPGLQASLSGIVVFAVFMWFWIAGMIVAEGGAGA